ncbi:HAD-IA family hydrolase [Tranquillimonas alkanivorans]|uniref:Phosphoglycolate phosphatase n=1 Tax=Tranquillimonas alkanivorans TaxID=441119 RepID=A0A1I5SX27_9RHOB|nr:HAD-IA family hydrolase [Tranquillimonas alkanivorans]SFP75335.1 phosphoglycolate phosphatase [Tranquillimonas alkanivorans]
MSLTLVIFDVDGTLVDSQAQITASMQGAFVAEGLKPPSRAAVLTIVGLSLPQAIAQLAPGQGAATVARLVEGYKDHYTHLRANDPQAGGSPLFPGAREALERLAQRDEVLLGVATGKSRRGLTHVIETHDLAHFFLTTQVADDHPSKPHPSMIQACMAATGAEAARTVMVGDTSFDMEMGRAAGVRCLGVDWGYHPRVQLQAAGAERILDDFAALDAALDEMWEIA